MAIPSPRTMLGPLTTTWTPPGLCTYGVAVCDTCTTVWQAQTCNTASDAHDFTGCWPNVSGPQSTVDPGVMMGWGLYSPGYICPVGYSTAAMVSSGGATGSWGVEYSFSSGETAIACCPTGYSISYISTLSTYGQTCITTLRSTSFSTVQCASGILTNFAAATVPRTASNHDVLSSYVMFAPLFQLNFQQSDLPPGGLPGSTTTAGTGSSTAGSTPSQTSTLATQTSSTPNLITLTVSGSTIVETPSQSQIAWGGGNTSSGGSSNGLSTAAEIGIGVGAGVGGVMVLALLALAILAIRRRRRRTHGSPGTASSEAEGGGVSSSTIAAAGADTEKKQKTAAGAAGHKREVSELDGRPFYAELATHKPSDRVPPADPVHWRVSDQDWIVPPGHGTMDTGDESLDGAPGTPTRPHGNRLFELEGDSSIPNSSREGSVR